MNKRGFAFTGSLIFLLLPSLALAQQEHRILVQTSLWTKHFNPDPKHNNHQQLINLQLHPKKTRTLALTAEQPFLNQLDWFYGGAFFKNSFSQNTTYLYLGGRFNFLQATQENLQPYASLTGGFIHGYRGEYQDKIPFNNLGVAPAIIPSLGLEYRKVTTELSLFGVSGVMLKIGYFFK
ncbi:hypothetical protein P8S54_04245 [Thiomicrospira sp. R3]|uniref:hypothetical protein n=1 Tax=Thiomicrospira sp. R3 TaxID=3035472 RepID=UPI00259B7444|nr:hypothetical protein [Thiomicrospira sp. R3]WFE69516.1 hypothetical protein P8S54_04245 [Thiomicrospira sp. R3]